MENKTNRENYHTCAKCKIEFFAPIGTRPELCTDCVRKEDRKEEKQ